MDGNVYDQAQKILKERGWTWKFEGGGNGFVIRTKIGLALLPKGINSRTDVYYRVIEIDQDLIDHEEKP